MEEKDTMPKMVTVTRSWTYDVQEIINNLTESHGTEPTWEEVEEVIAEWVEEDMRSPISNGRNLSWFDENGEEL